MKVYNIPQQALGNRDQQHQLGKEGGAAALTTVTLFSTILQTLRPALEQVAGRGEGSGTKEVGTEPEPHVWCQERSLGRRKSASLGVSRELASRAVPRRPRLRRRDTPSRTRAGCGKRGPRALQRTDLKTGRPPRSLRNRAPQKCRVQTIPGHRARSCTQRAPRRSGLTLRPAHQVRPAASAGSRAAPSSPSGHPSRDGNPPPETATGSDGEHGEVVGA